MEIRQPDNKLPKQEQEQQQTKEEEVESKKKEISRVFDLSALTSAKGRARPPPPFVPLSLLRSAARLRLLPQQKPKFGHVLEERPGRI